MADESRQATQEVEATEPHGEEAPDYKALYEQALAQSRKWEGRAKANKEKAAKWDAYEQEGMSEAEKLAKRAESAEAELAKLRAEEQRRADAAEVSAQTGVPTTLLLYCDSREHMEAFAEAYQGEAKVPAAPQGPQSRIVRDDGGSKASTAERFAEALGL